LSELFLFTKTGFFSRGVCEMNEKKRIEPPGDVQEVAPGQIPADDSRAWTEIEPGRFMPRRIRGSYRGGKLG
jgi:hypothetical protein